MAPLLLVAATEMILAPPALALESVPPEDMENVPAPLIFPWFNVTFVAVSIKPVLTDTVLLPLICKPVTVKLALSVGALVDVPSIIAVSAAAGTTAGPQLAAVPQSVLVRPDQVILPA